MIRILIKIFTQKIAKIKELIFNFLCFNGIVERVGSEGTTDKLKRGGSVTGTKMAPAERLRPIGASAEEEVCENDGKLLTDTKQQEGGGERPVHIIIKPQEEVGTERKNSQECTECLPPVI